MEGLTLLQDVVGNEKRPLSWIAGAQGVVRPPSPSRRDLIKTPEAARITTLRTPDRIS
jgi:NADH-quinone oxidoreductase subunit B